MVQVVKTVFYFGPLIFGLGFIAPLSAQIIDAILWIPPFGLSSLTIGLITGGALGLLAQFRGRWV